MQRVQERMQRKRQENAAAVGGKSGPSSPVCLNFFVLSGLFLGKFCVKASPVCGGSLLKLNQNL